MFEQVHSILLFNAIINTGGKIIRNRAWTKKHFFFFVSNDYNDNKSVMDDTD